MEGWSDRVGTKGSESKLQIINAAAPSQTDYSIANITYLITQSLMTAFQTKDETKREEVKVNTESRLPAHEF